jgi:hypothetical protein
MRRRTLIATGLSAGLGAAQAAAAETPVVLELFTSQGCSSCPPADALLGELARQPNVFALAFHVDYWNRLGWPDPFASREWTNRQRAYARQLGTEVYTPALVVNGSAMVVGSNRNAVARAMRDAAELPVPLTLRRDGTQLRATIDRPPADATLILAVYDPERVTEVRAGENGGRMLLEFQIVREVRPLVGVSGAVTLAGINAAQGAVLMLRDAAGRVIGAAETRAV